MGSKGGSSEVQTSEPWAQQAPYLQDTFRQAQNLFNTGGPQFFGDATYTPFSQQTEQGLGLTEQRALGGSPVTDAAQNFAAQSLSSNPQFGGGLNYLAGGPSLQNFSNFAGVGQGQQFQGADVGGLGGVGQGQFGFDQAQQPFQNQITGLPGAAQDALSQTAQGQNLQGNPYLDQQFDIASQRVTDKFNQEISPGLAAQFSLAGRAGSPGQADIQGRAAGEVSDSLSNLANQIYGGNYQAERDRQLNAAGQLGSLSQGQQGLGLQAAGQGADLYGMGQQQDIARRGLESQNLLGQSGQGLQALLGQGQQDISRTGLAGQLFNQAQGNQLGAAGLDANIYGQQLAQQTGLAGMANNLANQDYSDIDRLLGVGGRVEGLSNQALQDQMNRFNFYQNAPQTNLANYIAAIQGNYGGTQTQQGGGGNGLTGALGGAATGFATGGPFGAVLGGLGGLFG